MGGRPFLMAALPNNTVSTPKASAVPASDLSAVELILNTLDDAKAEDTVSVDITGKSSLADHMIVTSGRSQRHVGAVADQVISALRDNGFGKPRVEGLPHCDWVLVDTGDVIVHIFRPEVREFYNIEKMWQADFAADAH
jgi:ribosome-associated protein